MSGTGRAIHEKMEDPMARAMDKKAKAVSPLFTVFWQGFHRVRGAVLFDGAAVPAA